MINTKGKDKIFFILIPVFVLVFSFIFDIILIQVQEARVKRATREIMTELHETNVVDYTERATQLFEDRRIETEKLYARESGGRVYIFNTHNYQAFFGRILGIKTYGIDVSVVGYYHNDRLVIMEIDPDDVFDNPYMFD